VLSDKELSILLCEKRSTRAMINVSIPHCRFLGQRRDVLALVSSCGQLQTAQCWSVNMICSFIWHIQGNSNGHSSFHGMPLQTQEHCQPFTTEIEVAHMKSGFRKHHSKMMLFHRRRQNPNCFVPARSGQRWSALSSALFVGEGALMEALPESEHIASTWSVICTIFL
jgi:hypothetical protein